jgi:hypothetical protein
LAVRIQDLSGSGVDEPNADEPNADEPDAGAAGSYSPAQLTEAITQLNALETVVLRQKLALIAEADRTGAWREDGATSMADWLCYKLDIAKATALEWVEAARSLGRLPVIASAMNRGELSWDKARNLVKIATPESEGPLLDDSRHRTVREIASAARRAVLTREAAEAQEDDRRFLRMWFENGSTGALRLRGRLRPEQGAVVKAALERLAEQAPKRPDGGVESMQARLADALADVAGARLAQDADPARATIVVHVDAETLTTGDGVAEVEDGPLLGAETARRLICDSRNRDRPTRSRRQRHRDRSRPPDDPVVVASTAQASRQRLHLPRLWPYGFPAWPSHRTLALGPHQLGQPRLAV